MFSLLRWLSYQYFYKFVTHLVADAVLTEMAFNYEYIYRVFVKRQRTIRKRTARFHFSMN